MATFNLKKHFYFLSLLALCFAMSACDVFDNTHKCTPCPEAPTIEPGITFSVVDKTTGNNLFFGSGAIYKQSQIKVYHLVNGQPDSIHLIPDTTVGDFRMNVPTVHSTDTVTMNIASLPQDVFLFKTTIRGGCCSTLIFDSVLYNGLTVYTPADRLVVVVIKK